ncbi:MAG: AAA family ATPase [archaeon]|nr:MAG: AAA family ATPase [archaeon]
MILMVSIEKVSMQGFKSFPNKTALPFPSGFNVICGANGSGKSNIVDALCFVLGIRSAKSIRAEKLEQLIFNGGKKRPSAKYGVVNLYLDNQDREITGEEESVKITRKVNKNGVCIYKLNGKTVNRRKIVDILGNARIQADGHNIIMQGDVTNLIDMTPLQRRGIIDEISGIAEFEDKKTKTENELIKVDNKLKEAQIILGEKEKALRKLEREQKLAKEFKSLEEEEKTLSSSIIHIKLGTARKNLSELKEALEKMEKEFKEIDKEFSGHDSSMEEKQNQMKEMTSRALKRNRDTEAYNRLDTEISKHRNKIESNLREIQRLEDLIGRLSQDDEISSLLKKRPGVYGSVAELFTTDSKYQVALEVAAGGRLRDIIVKSDMEAAECIEHLKSKRIGRATFLPLNKIRYHEEKHKKEPGVIDFAINLVDYDKKYDPAMKYVFAQTLVVDKLENARKLVGRYRMVTLEGELLLKSGAITGGFRKKSRAGEVSKYREDKKALEGENEYLKDLMAVAEEKLKKLQEQDQKDVPVEYEGKIAKIGEEIEEIRKKRHGLYDKRMTYQTKIGNLRVKRAKLETEIENLELEFEEFEGMESFLDQDLESMQNQKKNVKEKLRRIGAVNLKAIEDYDSMKMLYDDLKEKTGRIEKEKQSILQMVEKIESRRREVFMKAFEAVNKNFGDIFQDISEGSANMELEEPEDIRSGLIIRARPKGKKMLSIDSMSGGEKTITALAFLFAVQMYKPAPFYVLDEVDAALDKINSKKIGTLIKKQSSRAQFIVITHNDVTIKMADQVYGISMEDGVSKVMAIKMPEN